MVLLLKLLQANLSSEKSSIYEASPDMAQRGPPYSTDTGSLLLVLVCFLLTLVHVIT